MSRRQDAIQLELPMMRMPQFTFDSPSTPKIYQVVESIECLIHFANNLLSPTTLTKMTFSLSILLCLVVSSKMLVSVSGMRPLERANSRRVSQLERAISRQGLEFDCSDVSLATALCDLKIFVEDTFSDEQKAELEPVFAKVTQFKTSVNENHWPNSLNQTLSLLTQVSKAARENQLNSSVKSVVDAVVKSMSSCPSRSCNSSNYVAFDEILKSFEDVRYYMTSDLHYLLKTWHENTLHLPLTILPECKIQFPPQILHQILDNLPYLVGSLYSTVNHNQHCRLKTQIPT